MKENYFNQRTFLLIQFVLATAMIRVVTNIDPKFSVLANFSPIGAMAVFGGAYFDKKTKAFLFPLLMLFISDLILSQTVFKNSSHGFLYGGWYWVYGSFALMVMAGRWLLKKITTGRFLISTMVCVLIHWLITDLGVWAGSTIYTQDLKGYLYCLGSAVPFEWRFMTGTLVYGIILFGLFEWMGRKYSILKMTKA